MAPRIMFCDPLKRSGQKASQLSQVTWNSQQRWSHHVADWERDAVCGVGVSLASVADGADSESIAVEGRPPPTPYGSRCESLCSEESSRATYYSKRSIFSSQIAEEDISLFSVDSPQLATHLALDYRRRVCSVVEWEGPIEDSFEVYGELGRGSFGVVLEARCRRTRELRAIKCIQLEDDSDTSCIQNELEIARRVSHPYIVKLHEAFRGKNVYHFVMELCEGGTLFDRIQGAWGLDGSQLENHLGSRMSGETTSNCFSGAPHQADNASVSTTLSSLADVRGLSSPLVAMYAWQMLAGVAYLHHQRFCHRDIKAENFQLKSRAVWSPLQMTDFGLSKNFAQCKRMSSKVGTPYATAPEVHDGSYDEKCDVWSVGIVCFMCYTGSWPLLGETPKEPAELSRTGPLKYVREDLEVASGRGAVAHVAIVDARSRKTPPS